MNDVKHCCESMHFHLANDEIGLIFDSAFREYGFRYQDGGTGVQMIAFCPWCGAVLPKSLRDAWFSELELIGIKDPWADDASLTPEFKSAEWWMKRGL